MASTVTKSRYNIIGASYGIPNNVVYFGPILDLTSVDSPITIDNTLRVWRHNETTGAWEYYEPGAGGNDFTTMDRGSLAGGVTTGYGLGRGYIIVAKSSFIMDNVAPA